MSNETDAENVIQLHLRVLLDRGERMGLDPNAQALSESAFYAGAIAAVTAVTLCDISSDIVGIVLYERLKKLSLELSMLSTSHQVH